ncbi:DUF1707 SHOCT-like domain-containing protein [Aestuariimicrobium soli]|uniref:DUF1707 SHOCT-like domain-containing protein n=1 Tax=Aestuariimicrobium soli TaxID=2035834 RepID=UPI003EC05937
MSDVPQRIGDTERDKAVQELQAHHAAGRLDLSEFEERMQRALQAKTMADLRPLFVDLPTTDFASTAGVSAAQALAVPREATAVSSEATPKQPTTSAQRTARLVTGLMWPAALIINFAFGWEWWWLMLVPVFVMPVILNSFGIEDRSGRRKVHGDHRGNRREIE